ncbi:MAG TPA: nitroreductase family protein [Burkholderiales bacterium]|nr:nitroreductase family protein [Burkholderiales bacterium]
MNVTDAIKLRRAVKNYDPEHRLSETEIETLMSVTLLSPTAFNIQNWRFVQVRDKALRQEIRQVAWDQAQVTDASLLLVLCADLKAWEKDPARYWRNAAQPVQDFMVPAIHDYYLGRDRVQQDEAMRSCGIAAMALMLQAKEMGYDSCPMDGFDFDAVGKLINLPADHVIAMMVAIGKGIKEPWPRGGQLPLNEVVITDKFATGGQRQD